MYKLLTQEKVVARVAIAIYTKFKLADGPERQCTQFVCVYNQKVKSCMV